MVAKVIREFVDKVEGFEVVGESRDGKIANGEIQKKQPQLIIMDVYMPDMDGVELLKNLRKESIPVDVIFITAARETDTIIECMRFGAFDYILKPFSYDRFEESLKHYVKFRQLINMKECQQADLDTILHGKMPKIAENSLPKGLQQLTLDKIIDFLQSHPIALSADEIAVQSGLSKPTVQRYLKFLNEEGKVTKELTYGTQGRPEHKYSLV